ncbi:MAG: YqgE/AlgH family protein [Ilumatobacteraceae bacterium]
MGQTRGHLLVATPPLADPNFDRTVVYMLEHTSDGAVGVVLNRPLHEPLPDQLDPWQHLLSEPATLHQGGPVDESALIALAQLSGPIDGAWSLVADGMGSIDLLLDPDEVGGSVTALRVFQGYSGWGPGQLDDELDAGAWMVLAAEPNDVFGPQPESLWREVLRRQGGRVAWLANAPDDLSTN